MREGLMDDCGYHGLDECRNYESCTLEAYEHGKADAFDDENIIEIAKRLKEYCEKHHSHNTKIGCDWIIDEDEALIDHRTKGKTKRWQTENKE